MSALLWRMRHRVTFTVYRVWEVTTATLLRRHDHDGPTLGFCSCGCPVIGCPPCGRGRTSPDLQSTPPGGTDG